MCTVFILDKTENKCKANCGVLFSFAFLACEYVDVLWLFIVDFNKIVKCTNARKHQLVGDPNFF